MDIRVLRYFLTVAREESFSRAAESLYISQPTLSRQIQDMEQELGTALFTRTNRSVQLTRDGMRLRKRAQEIVDLMDRTRDEFANLDEAVTGDVMIGGGETQMMRLIAKIAVAVQREYPGIRYHLFSGNADDVTERLDKGLLDLGVLLDPADLRKYDSLRIPGKDTWGLLMRRDHPLTAREGIAPRDLIGQRLILSRHSAGALSDWMGQPIENENVVCSYNLVFNAAVMVEQGMGCALCLDRLVNTMDLSGLCFRPLAPRLEIGLSLVWKKYQVFSPAAELFIRRLQQAFRDQAKG